MFAEDKTIYELKSVEKIVECIKDGVYGVAAIELMNLCETFSNNNYDDYLRVACIPFLFNKFEKLIEGEEEPGHQFSVILKDLKKYLESGADSKMRNIFEASQEFDVKQGNQDIELATGEHYGNLFKGFSPDKYFNEAKELLKKRLEVNNIDISEIKNWMVLDQGCGGGRYAAAWALLGAKKVIGVDISEIGINDAKSRATLANIPNLEYIQGNVLELPFEDNEFDLVFSNGVLHHTQNWKKGLNEQVRVLKSGGLGWQYLIEQPGGIFWDKIEILRFIVRNVNKNFAIKVLKGFGIPSNRIFYMLDHVMVPINTRVSPSDLETELLKRGAKNIKRLIRGVGYDRVEYIYRDVPYALRKFGVGENRFIFTK